MILTICHTKTETARRGEGPYLFDHEMGHRAEQLGKRRCGGGTAAAQPRNSIIERYRTRKSEQHLRTVRDSHVSLTVKLLFANYPGDCASNH